MNSRPTPSDIIDVQVTLSAAPMVSHEDFVRDTLSHRPLDRQGRHAMQESASALLLPELHRVAVRVVEQVDYRMPATPAALRAIEAALASRLQELGVDDVFDATTKLVDDNRGVPCLVELRLGPTESERLQFGYFTDTAETP